MDVKIESLPEKISVTGGVTADVKSQLVIKEITAGTNMVAYPNYLGLYDLNINAGVYAAELFVGNKKASFDLSESVDLTVLIDSMVEA